MTLPVRITDVSYFDNAYRGDLIITRGVLYYFPWVNVALEEKQSRDNQYDRLFPLSFVIQLIWGALTAYGAAHAEPRLNQLGLWQDGQTDEALQARLDAYITDQKAQPSQLMDYQYGLPHPMRFAAGEIKNLSLKSGLRFDTECDTHDFGISMFDERELRQALAEAGFVSEENRLDLTGGGDRNRTDE